MAVEAIDTHLGETAVLAVVLHAHTRLIIEAVGQRAGIDKAENPVVDHTDKRRTMAALEFALGTGDHNLLEHHGVGHYLEVEFERLAGLQGHLLALGDIARISGLHLVFARRQMPQSVVAGGIGGGADPQRRYADDVEGQMFAGLLIDYMTGKIRVGRLGLHEQSRYCKEYRHNIFCHRIVFLLNYENVAGNHAATGGERPFLKSVKTGFSPILTWKTKYIFRSDTPGISADGVRSTAAIAALICAIA